MWVKKLIFEYHLLVFYTVCVVQFYPWFKFYFPLFLGMVMYDYITSSILLLKQRKRKFEPWPRIK